MAGNVPNLQRPLIGQLFAPNPLADLLMLQGLILVLAMLIFSVFFQSGVAIDQNETDVVVMILKFGVFVLVRLFTLIGVIKSADHIVQQMLGL